MNEDKWYKHWADWHDLADPDFDLEKSKPFFELLKLIEENIINPDAMNIWIAGFTNPKITRLLIESHKHLSDHKFTAFYNQTVKDFPQLVADVLEWAKYLDKFEKEMK